MASIRSPTQVRSRGNVSWGRSAWKQKKGGSRTLKSDTHESPSETEKGTVKSPKGAVGNRWTGVLMQTMDFGKGEVATFSSALLLDLRR